MKASPLLRAWLRRLGDAGVTFAMRHRFIGWQDGALAFARPDGTTVTDRPDVTMLALGGASWPRLGSDGGWVAALAEAGSRGRPAATGQLRFSAQWSEPFRSRRAGESAQAHRRVTFAEQTVRGEAVDHRRRDRGRRDLCPLGPLREAIWHASEAPFSPSTCVPI